MPQRNPEERRAYMKAYAIKHKAVARAKGAAYRATPQYKAKRAAYELAHKDLYRQRQWVAKGKMLGWSEDMYKAVLAAQRGLCAGCGRRPVEILHRDHNHITGKPRGLLCCDCNLALGMIKDKVYALRGLADYLERYE